MEVERGGTVKLAIGNQDGHSGAAVILAQPTGLVQIQLRSPTGVGRISPDSSRCFNVRPFTNSMER